MTTVQAKYSGKFLPEVNVGDQVATGDTLCRISAWGIKFRMDSPCDGILAEILAENGADVEKNEELFRIDDSISPPPGVTPPPIASGPGG